MRWNTEREYPEEELGRRLEAILDPAPAGSRVVVNFHCPPYGTGLDFAAELPGQGGGDDGKHGPGLLGFDGPEAAQITRWR